MLLPCRAAREMSALRSACEVLDRRLAPHILRTPFLSPCREPTSSSTMLSWLCEPRHSRTNAPRIEAFEWRPAEYTRGSRIMQ